MRDLRKRPGNLPKIHSTGKKLRQSMSMVAPVNANAVKQYPLFALTGVINNSCLCLNNSADLDDQLTPQSKRTSQAHWLVNPS